MRHTTAMPKIDLSKIDLTEDERKIVAGIINTKTGQLRASKPKVERHCAGKDQYGLKIYVPDELQGKTAYVWRMVAFSVSPIPAHHCMPCTAEFDLPWSDDRSERRELSKAMDAIADKVVNSIPKSQWHGVTRWAQAYGLTGTPQYNDEGAIIYR